MKFGQLIEYNIRDIFLEESFTKCGGETIPRLLSKKSKLGISLDQLSEVLWNLFLSYPKSKAMEISDQMSLTGCLYFMRYWAIYLLQLFVNQVVTSYISKLTLSF